MAEPPTDLPVEDSTSDTMSRLRTREEWWNLAIAEGIAIITVGLIVIHTAWPRTGLLAGFPVLIVLYPSYRWVRAVRLEERIGTGGVMDKPTVAIVDRPFVVTAVLALAALALDAGLALVRG